MVFEYGDNPWAWAPSSTNGDCKSRGTDIFYTEFLVVRIATPVYVTEVEVMENLNPGTVTRILAQYPDGSGYYPLWYGKPVVYSGCVAVAHHSFL